MIAIGKKQTLEASRNAAAGMYLVDKKGNEVLLPNKYVPKSLRVGELLEVFIYNDSEDRPVATTIVPLIELGGFAFLKVNQVSSFGAFMDWGMEKDLLVPSKEQDDKMEEGQSYVVHMFLDESTNRLVGSSKIKKYLVNENMTLEVGKPASAMIFDDTPLGYLAIVNNEHKGLIYHNEVFGKLRMGEILTVYIKKIKEGGEIDLSLQKIGFKHVDDQTERILELLKHNKGFLNLSDNSSPEEIQSRLQVSKKVFKKAIGILYKQKKVRIEEDGVYLINLNRGPRKF
ncbi:MAG: GntR family transcriptional regulator [Bacteroidetes bacterium B1(2017)]|nr:MAG: GntR family transcriptional regulator [Bacteroidetes bacterium B1(2017)]